MQVLKIIPVHLWGEIYYLINCLPPNTGIRNNTHTAMVFDQFFDGSIIWWPHYLGYLLCGAGIKNNTREDVEIILAIVVAFST